MDDKNILNKFIYLSKSTSMGYFDTMQVCLNGHQITDTYHKYPEFRKNHCTKCGATTIHRCPNCSHEIKGEYHVEGFVDLSGATEPVPQICEHCGTPFPWSKNSKQTKSNQTENPNWIINLYREAVNNVPILKYSWTIIATICILALAAYFKLNNTDVFVYAIAVIIISFLAFVFSILLKTGDIFIKIVLYFFITCIIITMATAVLGLASYIVFQKPIFYERLFPNESDKTNPIKEVQAKPIQKTDKNSNNQSNNSKSKTTNNFNLIIEWTTTGDNKDWDTKPTAEIYDSQGRTIGFIDGQDLTQDWSQGKTVKVNVRKSLSNIKVNDLIHGRLSTGRIPVGNDDWDYDVKLFLSYPNGKQKLLSSCTARNSCSSVW